MLHKQSPTVHNGCSLVSVEEWALPCQHNVYNASLTSKVVWFRAWSSMVMLSHWGRCFSQACSAIADLSVSPCLVTAWCSLRRVSRLLLVSPMYASPQLQGILYTTLDFLRVGSVFFTLVSYCCSVLIVVKCVCVFELLNCCEIVCFCNKAFAVGVKDTL